MTRPVVLPPKTAKPTPRLADELRQGLLFYVYKNAGGDYPWKFYEVIDDYLGPWGSRGYPIGYGKKYCILFSSDRTLAQTKETEHWIERTTILLQTYLIDFVVDRFRRGSLSALTETELRSAAFNIHPKAYLEGGLATVLDQAPAMVPIIATIPGAEFSPRSENFRATWIQAFAAAIGVAAHHLIYLMPAHSQVFAIAARNDERAYWEDRRFLTTMKHDFDRGRLDDLKALSLAIGRLSEIGSSHDPDSAAALTLAVRMDARRVALVRHYKGLAKMEPRIEAWLDAYSPGWDNPGSLLQRGRSGR